MSRDLIVLIIAITLGVAVVGLGRRHPIHLLVSTSVVRSPPLQRRLIVCGYLLISLCNAALAVWADERLLHAIIAAGFALSAVAYWLKKWPYSVGGSTS